MVVVWRNAQHLDAGRGGLIVAGVWVGTVGKADPDEGLPGELGASGA
jgi:hypothetical protein